MAFVMAPIAFLSIVLGGCLSWFLLRLMVPYLVCYLLDQPNSRSSHLKPIPRGGGLAIVAVATIASIVATFKDIISASTNTTLDLVSLLALPLAVVGFLDDRHNLPVFIRYCVQLATSLAVIMISPLLFPSAGLLPLLIFSLIVVPAVINFTNFMDGLDGLVAGCMAAALTGASIFLHAPWPVWALVGALLGFLLWNWSPAKVFMGDVGSTFLGAVFSALVLQASTWAEALALFLVATPLLVDAFICVLRRLIDGQRVFQAHRLHLFQRLHQAGWSHARVSSLYIAATSILTIALLSGGLPWVITLSAVELLIGFWLDQRVAVSFAVSSRS